MEQILLMQRPHHDPAVQGAGRPSRDSLPCREAGDLKLGSHKVLRGCADEGQCEVWREDKYDALTFGTYRAGRSESPDLCVTRVPARLRGQLCAMAQDVLDRAEDKDRDITPHKRENGRPLRDWF